MTEPIIHDNGKTNPLIEVPRQMVLDWLRSVADEAGLADRDSVSVQTYLSIHSPDQIEGEALALPVTPDRTEGFWSDAPNLILMVSNIPNSRPALTPDGDRPDGHYWVRLGRAHSWEVMRWDGTHFWGTAGDGYRGQDFEVGPRVYPPAGCVRDAD